MAALVAVVILTITACGPAKDSPAAKYPEKEITLVCPWSPGGSSDLLARAIAQSANKKLPKPIIVVNRDGAAGVIATTELAKAKPDGYTMAVGATGLFAIQPFMKKVDYQTSDFDFLIGISNEPIVLAVKADSPYKTLGDLLARAKAEGAVIRYGNSGMGSVPHLCLAQLFRLAGVQAQPVPYKSNTPALAALMGGHLDVSAAHPGEAIPQIRAGMIRALAISSPQRFSALPDVPTMQEQGYQIDMGVRKFIMVPKAVPADVKQRLTQIVQEAIADAEFKKGMADINLMLEPMTGPEVVNILTKEATLMQKLIADTPKADAK
jgi:tripartite-type tricarboxylate transporter receptor subunit TctC